MNLRLALSLLAASLACPAAHALANHTHRTLAEQTSFRRTGRYAEVEQLCSAFQSTWPKQVRCFEFGCGS